MGRPRCFSRYRPHRGRSVGRAEKSNRGQLTKEILMKKHQVRSTILTLLAAGAVVISPALAASYVQDSDHVSQLLSDAKTQTFQLREDASTMESFKRSNLGWESHAATVSEMKEHVNAAGGTLAKLDDARKTASPWQATAIDRIKPLLKEMASNTEPVIQYLNKNPKRLFMNQYKD